MGVSLGLCVYLIARASHGQGATTEVLRESMGQLCCAGACVASLILVCFNLGQLGYRALSRYLTLSRLFRFELGVGSGVVSPR